MAHYFGFDVLLLPETYGGEAVRFMLHRCFPERAPFFLA